MIKFRDLPILGTMFLAMCLAVANAPVQKQEEVRVIKFDESIPDSVIVIDRIILEADETERELMAQIVMNEAEGEPQDGKQAVAQVIVNRVLSPKFPDTIREVVYQESQFATSGTKTPTQECYDAVDSALKYEGFPPDMFYFRNKHYHSFGKPYCQIGNHYFSTED